MCSQPGRKPKISIEEVKSVILRRKTEILLDDGKLVGKNSDVWKYLSADLQRKLSARTLHSKTCIQKFRTEVLQERPNRLSLLTDTSDNEKIHQSMNENMNRTIGEGDFLEFTVFGVKSEYEGLLISKTYAAKATSRRNQVTRFCLRLEPCRLKDWISNKIWDITKLPCGFNFHRHYISENGASGKIEGTLKNILFAHLLDFIDAIKQFCIENYFNNQK